MIGNDWQCTKFKPYFAFITHVNMCCKSAGRSNLCSHAYRCQASVLEVVLMVLSPCFGICFTAAGVVVYIALSFDCVKQCTLLT